jgi:hypothetical protein
MGEEEVDKERLWAGAVAQAVRKEKCGLGLGNKSLYLSKTVAFKYS